MYKITLGVSNTETQKEKRFQSWKAMVEWMEQEIEKGTDWDSLLPFCNGWNLLYWERSYTKEEYRAALIDYAIGLQLIG